LFPVEDLEKLSSSIPDPSDIGYVLQGAQNLAMRPANLPPRSYNSVEERRQWVSLFLQKFSCLKTLSFLKVYSYGQWSKFKPTTGKPWVTLKR
jgi:hypothetical protein